METLSSLYGHSPLATSWPPVVEGLGGRLSLETLRAAGDEVHGASSSACDTCE